MTTHRCGGGIDDTKNEERDPSEEVAGWLQEVGRRRSPGRREERREELLAHLEFMAGKKLRTREEITEYVKDLSHKGEAGAGRRGQLKNLFLGVLLIVAMLQYYFIDVQLQILSQPALTVFVPVKAVGTGGRS